MLIAKDPKAIETWRRVEADGLHRLKSDPEGSAKAIVNELGISLANAEAQLTQGVFLTPQQVASADRLAVSRV